jgi:DNA-binding transcriptional LysR family regulator
MQSAADHLCITVSAVSHQVRHLEAELNVQLFRRTGRGLELTREGQALLPGINLGFDQLSATVDRFRRRTGPNFVTISISASFAMRWFLGRLSSFYEQHPSIEVHITTHVGRKVERDASVDCFIHFGGEDWPDLEGEMLFAEHLEVACSPVLLRKTDHAITAPEDVLKCRILRAEDRASDWPLWFQAMGISVPPDQRMLSFQNSNLAIQAAIEGLGVILAEPVEIAEELQTGRLVQPLDPSLAMATRAYYFYAMPDLASTGPVSHLRDCLLGELAIAPAEACRRMPPISTPGTSVDASRR